MENLHRLDLRGLSHEEKHSRIVPALENLKKGDQLKVHFDFNPLPLIYMLQARPDLQVNEEKNGPDKWILRIEKPGNGTPGESGRTVELDLRPLPPPQRHKLIFDTWATLKPGDTLCITNDHDPKPLYYQFQAEHTGTFHWEYEEQGPVDWKVRIHRL